MNLNNFRPNSILIEKCLMENSADALYFIEATEQTFAYKIFRKLSNTRKVCFIREGKSLRAFGKDYLNYFIIASEFIIKVSFSSSFLFNKKSKIYRLNWSIWSTSGPGCIQLLDGFKSEGLVFKWWLLFWNNKSILPEKRTFKRC